jgi:hypothetical protein
MGLVHAQLVARTTHFPATFLPAPAPIPQDWAENF